MDGDVESVAKREVQEAAAPAADAASAEVSEIVLVRRAVGEEAVLRLPELKEALVKAALNGNVQAAKLLLQILHELAADRASEAIAVTRSIAEEWGVEPEWSSERCIHCATAMRDEGDVG